MRIYRAKPIAWTDSSVALLNEYGATLCTPAPPDPVNASMLSLLKTPVKNTVGAVSHAGSKSARMEQKRKLRKKILSCLFSL